MKTFQKSELEELARRYQEQRFGKQKVAGDNAVGPNMTPRWRRAMTCAYMPDGSTYNGQKEILSDEYAAGLKIGDLLDDNRQIRL